MNAYIYEHIQSTRLNTRGCMQVEGGKELQARQVDYKMDYMNLLDA